MLNYVKLSFNYFFKGINFYQISWLCFGRLGRKRNNLKIYIKIQDKSVTHQFVLTKSPLTAILQVNFII